MQKLHYFLTHRYVYFLLAGIFYFLLLAVFSSFLAEAPSSAGRMGIYCIIYFIAGLLHGADLKAHNLSALRGSLLLFLPFAIVVLMMLLSPPLDLYGFLDLGLTWLSAYWGLKISAARRSALQYAAGAGLWVAAGLGVVYFVVPRFDYQRLTASRSPEQVLVNDLHLTPLRDADRADSLLLPIASHADFEGKTLVLEFWGTSCGACMRQLPHFQKIAERLKGREDVRVAVVASARYDPVARVRNNRFLKKYQLDVYYDPFKEWDQRLAFSGIPVTLVVDPKGKVVYDQRGFAESAAPLIEKHILDLVAGIKP